jgi:hypothetical protein
MTIALALLRSRARIGTVRSGWSHRPSCPVAETIAMFTFLQWQDRAVTRPYDSSLALFS